MPTITAARIYKGQKKGQTGEEENLTFDKFPYAAFSRVTIIYKIHSKMFKALIRFSRLTAPTPKWLILLVQSLLT